MANYKMVIEDNEGNGYLPAPGLPTKTAAQLNAENRVLLFGEMVQESDTKKIKIGDGVKPYTTLPETNIETGFTQLIGTNGYKKITGGLMLQWGVNAGVVGGDANLNQQITFPIAFPSCIACVFNRQYLNGLYTDVLNKNVWMEMYDLNGFKLIGNNLNANINFQIHWFAIGH